MTGIAVNAASRSTIAITIKRFMCPSSFVSASSAGFYVNQRRWL